MNIAVYCGSCKGTDVRFEEAARKLGEWIGAHGHSLVYGGSSVGIMGVVSECTMGSGGCAYGVEPKFFIDAGVAQRDLTELYVVETMAERKAKMIELADAYVALPGGIGTLEEITEIMSRVRLGLDVSECYLLNIGGFYDPFISLLDNMFRCGFIAQADIDRYHFPHTTDELIALLEFAERYPRECLVTAAELIERKQELPHC